MGEEKEKEKCPVCGKIVIIHRNPDGNREFCLHYNGNGEVCENSGKQPVK